MWTETPGGLRKVYNGHMKPQHQATDRWKKEHVKNITFYINKDTEGDILKHLESKPSRRLYLVGLIRDDMQKGGN